MNWLNDVYFYVLALHIVSVISWMAGMFYLPRLFVYHVERGSNGVEPAATFTIMEDKLFRLIMRPAMFATWGFGIVLVMTPGVVDWSSLWPWFKLVGVVGMTMTHVWLGRCKDRLAAGTNVHSGRVYRLANELPTALMLLIVAAVVIKF